MEKPVEFEIKDYDTAIKNSQYPQIVRENPTPNPKVPTQDPEIKQEPLEETPNPQSTKILRALRNLESNIEGKAWECTETHRQRLRARKTGIHKEEEYQDNWENMIPAENIKTAEEDCSNKIHKPDC